MTNHGNSHQTLVDVVRAFRWTVECRNGNENRGKTSNGGMEIENKNGSMYIVVYNVKCALDPNADIYSNRVDFVIIQIVWRGIWISSLKYLSGSDGHRRGCC